MSIDYDNLENLRERTAPAPWRAEGDDIPRETRRTVYDGNGDYLGIMHDPNVDLAILAPEMADELLRLNKELKTMHRVVSGAVDMADHIQATDVASILRGVLREISQVIGDNHEV